MESGTDGQSEGFFVIEVDDCFFTPRGLKRFDHGVERGIVFGCKGFFHFSVFHPSTAVLGNQNSFLDVGPSVPGK